MAKTKQQKIKAVEDFTGKLSGVKAMLFADFRGLKVSETSELRRECRKNGVSYVVIKKSLLKRALAAAGINDFDPQSVTTSLATFLSADEVAPAKIVSKFAKTHDKLVISGGMLGNKVIDLAMIKNLAALPSKDELLAKVVGTIAAPMSGFVNVLQGNLRNLVYVLAAVRDKKQ